MQRLLDAVHRDTAASDAFASVVAGTLSPDAFFDPANIAGIMEAVSVAGPRR